MSVEPARPKNNGTAIYMNGTEWIVPALGVRDARENISKLITSFKAIGDGPESFQKVIDESLPIIHMAFKRNYPDVTQEQLLDMLDIRTFSEVIQAVMAHSGVTLAKPGE